MNLGASRYQASSSAAPSTGVSGDPFTGGSRYQPQPSSGPSSTNINPAVGLGDPLTGETRYTPASSGASSSTSASVASGNKALKVIPVVRT